jgi:hypothetical protein
MTDDLGLGRNFLERGSVKTCQAHGSPSA